MNCRAFFLPKMRNRLTIGCVALGLVGVMGVGAEVIDFEGDGDMGLFEQSASGFWSQANGTGLSGSVGVVGANNGTSSYMIYKVPIAPGAESVSGGVFVKLEEMSSEVVSSGYVMLFGVTGASTYVPNLSTVGGGDTTKNHYLGGIQYNNNSLDRGYRAVAHYSVDGALEINISSYQSIDYDTWYYLSLESTFDEATSQYQLEVSIHQATEAGVIGAPLMSASAGNFSIPKLSGAEENYLFFGMEGRAATRGVVAVDNFTFNVIPEPTVVGLVGFVWMCFAMSRSAVRE